MKKIKRVTVFSDGSCYLHYGIVTSVKLNNIIFKKIDYKNSNLYNKKNTKNFFLKNSKKYKKLFFKK